MISGNRAHRGVCASGAHRPDRFQRFSKALLPKGSVGVQDNFNGFRIREGGQKNLSEVLPQLCQLPFRGPVLVHAADVYRQIPRSARKRE